MKRKFRTLGMSYFILLSIVALIVVFVGVVVMGIFGGVAGAMIGGVIYTVIVTLTNVGADVAAKIAIVTIRISTTLGFITALLYFGYDFGKDWRKWVKTLRVKIMGDY